MNRSVISLVVLAALVFAGLSGVFIVDEREKALVMRFGRVVNVQEAPGLALKMPFVDEVVKYDDRILSLEVGPLEVTSRAIASPMCVVSAKRSVSAISALPKAVSTTSCATRRVKFWVPSAPTTSCRRIVRR